MTTTRPVPHGPARPSDDSGRLRERGTGDLDLPLPVLVWADGDRAGVWGADRHPPIMGAKVSGSLVTPA